MQKVTKRQQAKELTILAIGLPVAVIMYFSPLIIVLLIINLIF